LVFTGWFWRFGRCRGWLVQCCLEQLSPFGGQIGGVASPLGKVLWGSAGIVIWEVMEVGYSRWSVALVVHYSDPAASRVGGWELSAVVSASMMSRFSLIFRGGESMAGPSWRED
jgi:hypothetical protein